MFFNSQFMVKQERISSNPPSSPSRTPPSPIPPQKLPMPPSNHLRFVLPRQIVSGFCHEATQFICEFIQFQQPSINLPLHLEVLEQFNL